MKGQEQYPLPDQKTKLQCTLQSLAQLHLLCTHIYTVCKSNPNNCRYITSSYRSTFHEISNSSQIQSSYKAFKQLKKCYDYKSYYKSYQGITIPEFLLRLIAVKKVIYIYIFTNTVQDLFKKLFLQMIFKKCIYSFYKGILALPFQQSDSVHREINDDTLRYQSFAKLDYKERRTINLLQYATTLLKEFTENNEKNSKCENVF